MTKLVHDYSTTIEATPAAVFAALTTPADLRRWFAEDVSLEPAVSGTFRFGGRGAYAATTGRVLRFEPSSAFAFTYPVEGVDGEVTFTLAPDSEKPDATKLTVQHCLVATPAVARPKALLDDLWRLGLSNLAEHLKGGTGVMLVDFASTQPEVRLSLFIEAPPSSVFRALVEPELLEKWVAKKSVVEPRVGGRYSFGWQYEVDGRSVDGGPTRIVELVPNEKLVVDWPDWRGDPSVPAQQLTYLLAPEGNGTRLTLIHDGFVRPVDISDFPTGWLGFLGGLANVARTVA